MMTEGCLDGYDYGVSLHIMADSKFNIIIRGDSYQLIV